MPHNFNQVLCFDCVSCITHQYDRLAVLQKHGRALRYHYPSAVFTHATRVVQQQAAAAAAAAAARAEEEQKAVRPQRRAPARPVRTRAASPSSDYEEFEYDSPYARYKGRNQIANACS